MSTVKDWDEMGIRFRVEGKENGGRQREKQDLGKGSCQMMRFQGAWGAEGRCAMALDSNPPRQCQHPGWLVLEL